MNLTESSVKYPAATLIVALLMLCFGIAAALRLPIQLLPDLEPPQITIYTSWRAAAPQEVEEAIIEPQENVLRNIPGLESIVSNISRGGGFMQLNFAIGWDMQRALIDVISNLNQAPPLPEDADEPVVSVGNGEGRTTTATLQLYAMGGADTVDVAVYQDIVDRVVEPRIARLPGVSRLVLESERRREIAVSVDALRLAALGVSIQDVSNTLRRATDVSGGFADVGRRQYTVRFAGRQHVDTLGDLVVGWRNEQPIHLRDVATIEAGFAERNAISRRNGYSSYYMRVERQHEANTVELLDSLKLAIEELNAGALAEAGLTLELSFDASLHIRRAIAMVNGNLLAGLLLSSLVLWFFMRDVRSTALIAVTIPISLAAAVVVMKLCGLSINVISLAGLAFAVGLAMDSAIITQENILRHCHLGESPPRAAVIGTREVLPALLSSTLTSIAIFLPVLFIEGIEGQLFRDLAITLSAGVLVSLLASITLVPMASAHFSARALVADRWDGLWEQLSQRVMRITANARARLAWTIGVLGVSVALSVALMPRLDFLPKADIDAIITFFSLPPGTNLDTIENEIVGEISTRLRPYQEGAKQPAIRGFNIGVGQGWNALFVYPSDPEGVEPLMELLRSELLANIPDTQPFVQRASMLNFDGGGGGRAISMDIRGGDLEKMMAAATTGMEKVKALWPDATAFPMPALAMDEPELRIYPDDKRLGQAGMDRGVFGNAIRAFTGGLFAGEHFDGNRRYDIIIHGEGWHTPEELSQTPLATPLAGVQTVGELSRVESTVGPVQLARVDGQRTVTIVVIPPDQVPLEEAIERLETDVAPELLALLPEGASIRYRGSADRLAQAIENMGSNFLMALGILFAIMAAMFRSVRDSLLVLLVMVPAVAGGMVALRGLNLFTYQSLDMLTMIGFIILLGQVVNNAILLVDQTRTAERAGLDRHAAVGNAVRLRARPIFMSTLTGVFGMLPLMVVPGVGSEIYRGLAAVIVGGMLFSALLTLVLMPSVLRMGDFAWWPRTATPPVVGLEPDRIRGQ